MASSSAPNANTLVTLKINFEGINQRFKLPLHDLVAATLPGKLRSLLDIPSTSETIIERYSDSAAAFVVLDTDNHSVYKQLYRAAKAKLKLRLKVTVVEKTEKAPVMPRPASVEDEVPSSTEEPIPSFVSAKSLLEPATEFSEAGPSVTGIQSGFEHLTLKSNPRCTFINPYDNNQALSGKAEDRCAPANHEKTFADLPSMAFYRQLACNYKSAKNDHSCTIPAKYTVYCNHCGHPIPDEHYHCSICEDGDFDLCKPCKVSGKNCADEGHWLIKRSIKDGKVINSTTERLASRSQFNESKATLVQVEESNGNKATRTCNSCIRELEEDNFVTCTTCQDFDLCIECHIGLDHGHHPKHSFEPAVESMKLVGLAKTLLNAGRNTSHNAICDGCDKYIFGIRHKCLDCPDWDYCSDCIINADFIHPRHRFAPIYEPINERHLQHHFTHTRHQGIYCDGPLCTTKSNYIVGDRYKCAVCHDTDFCSSCEASPSSLHNKTHPLIKFSTPVRNVSVTTMGDHEDGTPFPIMGDRRPLTASKSTSTATTPSANAATQVKTVADLKPTEPFTVEEPDFIEDTAKHVGFTDVSGHEELVAHFVRDSVPDGSVLPPNCVFEQTWTLRNGGTMPWPAGCTIKFVGGDYMGAVDPSHPASIRELTSAAESTTCPIIVPGQEFGFTVLMRTPSNPGKAISYWRLTGPTGNKFGHRLWCDISVEEAPPALKKGVPAVEIKSETKEQKEELSQVDTATEKSQIIFPKLEKESPESSFLQSDVVDEKAEALDDFEQHYLDDDETEDGFLTDEEYDILDASDEEYLAEQEKIHKK